MDFQKIPSQKLILSIKKLKIMGVLSSNIIHNFLINDIVFC